MSVGKRARSDQRKLGTDKSKELARQDKAPDLEGGGGPQDSNVIQSVVGALGAAIEGAGEGQMAEHERMHQQGLHPDLDDRIPDAGRVPGRKAPARPVRSADSATPERPAAGEASREPSNPDVASTRGEDGVIGNVERKPERRGR